jgi:SAM-dependent methyltransferase
MQAETAKVWKLFSRLTRYPEGSLGTELLEYTPAFVAGALSAYATLPGGLRWTGDMFRHVFRHTAAFYDRDWAARSDYGHSLEEALSQLPVPRRAIDLASGTGFAARHIKQRFVEADVLGVDISQEMVELARHHATRAGLDVRFEIADTAKLPFPDGSFDLVVQQNSFPFLDELMRVLAPGGSGVMVFSYAGPWVQLAWPVVVRRLRALGAESVEGRRAFPGFYGIVIKPRG